MKQTPSLQFCILMDLLGCASYILPFLGEWYDLLWAPISAAVFYWKFGGKTRIFGTLFNLAEELLPFSDFIPTYMLAYFWQKKKGSD